MERRKKILGFEYINAGNFHFSENPYKFKNWTSEIVIKFLDPRYEKADESVYFLSIEDEIVYVGEFTYNLKDRWLSKGHVNHHMYDNIDATLKAGKEVSIWLAISPYTLISGSGELNISKSIEQQLIKQYKPRWNARNINSNDAEWREKHCIRLDSYL